MKKVFKKDTTEKKKQNSRTNRSILTCLCYLLVVLSVIVPTTMSAYVSTTSGKDETRVAIFNFVAEKGAGQTEDFSFNPNTGVTEGTYTFTVENQSEVSVRYDVVVVFPSKPQNITLKLDNVAHTTLSADCLTYTFSNVGQFSVADLVQSSTHTLAISIVGGTPYFEESIKDIQIVAIAEQVN